MRRLDATDVDGDGDHEEWFTYHYHTDAQGNVVAVTLAAGKFYKGEGENKQADENQLPVGTVMETYSYDVYGRPEPPATYLHRAHQDCLTVLTTQNCGRTVDTFVHSFAGRNWFDTRSMGVILRMGDN
jgi:hypothetical protein